MFIDEARIFLKGGNGGNGCLSFRREKYVPHGGPDGGGGGRGGNVIFRAKEDLRTLIDFHYHHAFKAGNGSHGKGSNKDGKDGEDLILNVPLGTVVADDKGKILADLISEDEEFIAVPGGQGGRGNASFTTPKRQAPSFAEKGEPGEEEKIRLELKILANVGLVGFPNVGKSSLISRISAARPKVAEYPFTTITPHLGVVFLDDGRSFSVADVPGLIEGAHHGKGMGTAFLKHLERTVVLLHVIDLASVEGRDPIIDFETIQKEVELYGSSFTTKKNIVAGNKIDLPRARKNLDAVTAYFNNKKIPFFPISAATGEGITPLIYYLADSLEKKETHVSEKVIVYELEESHDLIIDKTKEGWEIKNKKLERIVQMTDLDNEEAVAYLQERMKRFHLEEELLAKGAIEGDKVKISGFEFDFLPKT